MNIHVASGIVALMLAAAVQAQTAPAPNTSVVFKNPEKFLDAGDNGFSSPASPRVLADIKSHLETLGAKYLPAGQTLAIEVLDIDLAGRFTPLPGRESQWVRVARTGDWPRIRLHYKLSAPSGPLREADADVRDMNYLHRSDGAYSSENLRYEKRMLAEWFVDTFAAKKTP